MAPLGIRCRTGGWDLPPQHSRPSQAAQAQSRAEAEPTYPTGLAPTPLGRGLKAGTSQVQAVLWMSPRDVCLSEDTGSQKFPKRFGTASREYWCVCLHGRLQRPFIYSKEYMCSKSASDSFISSQWSEMKPGSLKFLLQYSYPQ